jgi:hypothetical protein
MSVSMVYSAAMLISNLDQLIWNDGKDNNGEVGTFPGVHYFCVLCIGKNFDKFTAAETEHYTVQSLCLPSHNILIYNANRYTKQHRRWSQNQGQWIFCINTSTEIQPQRTTTPPAISIPFSPLQKEIAIHEQRQIHIDAVKCI